MSPGKFSLEDQRRYESEVLADFANRTTADRQFLSQEVRANAYLNVAIISVAMLILVLSLGYIGNPSSISNLILAFVFFVFPLIATVYNFYWMRRFRMEERRIAFLEDLALSLEKSALEESFIYKEWVHINRSMGGDYNSVFSYRFVVMSFLTANIGISAVGASLLAGTGFA